jgi:hypothetical protein
LSCPRCGGFVGLSTETPEFISRVREKRGRNLSEREERIVNELRESATLLEKHGISAAYVLAGRRIGTTEAKAVLRKTKRVSDRFYEGIMKAERQVLRKRFL